MSPINQLFPAGVSPGEGAAQPRDTASTPNLAAGSLEREAGCFLRTAEGIARDATAWHPAPGELWRPTGRLPWPLAARIIFGISGLLWTAAVFAVARL